MIKFGSFHVVITFQIDPEKFDELLLFVKDFLNNEVSKDEGTKMKILEYLKNSFYFL